MAEGRFTGETVDGTEPQASQQDTEQEIRRRLYQANDRFRTQKKRHTYMLEDGEEQDDEFKELQAENNSLRAKMNKLTQAVENHCENRPCAYMSELETENTELREENERMTAMMDLFSRNQEEIETLRITKLELMHKLKELKADLYAKDETIMEYSTISDKARDRLDEHDNTIRVLQRKNRELEVQLKKRQQKQTLLCQRNLQDKTAAESVQQEQTKTASMFKRCATGLWKAIRIVGKVSLCAALAVGIVVNTVPIFDLADVAVDLLI